MNLKKLWIVQLKTIQKAHKKIHIDCVLLNKWYIWPTTKIKWCIWKKKLHWKLNVTITFFSNLIVTGNIMNILKHINKKKKMYVKWIKNKTKMQVIWFVFIRGSYMIWFYLDFASILVYLGWEYNSSSIQRKTSNVVAWSVSGTDNTNEIEKPNQIK